MIRMIRASGIRAVALGITATVAVACSDDEPIPSASELANRAYVVTRDADALIAIDLATLEIIDIVRTGAVTTHMAEVSADFSKVYLSSTDTDEVVVVDARTLEVTRRLAVHRSPAHMTLARDGRLLAVGNEEGNSVSFIDTATDREVQRVSGFYFPKFIRFSEDGASAYVANGGAHHVSRIDMATFAIVDEIALEGYSVPTMTAEHEGGFADVQIDHEGVLWGAHGETGRILVYDTRAERKLGELAGAAKPWVVYAEHPFGATIPNHYVPFHGDETVRLLDKDARSFVGSVPGDREAFGVNYSPVVPHLAFVMNREHQDISVVDTATRQVVKRIDAGGNTETAATTPNGELIIASVGTTNRIIVIDAATQAIIKTFDDLPSYPWSVTIPNGQNYCH